MKIEKADQFSFDLITNAQEDALHSINCRWDGCVNFRVQADDQWVHVCGLQGFIAELIRINNLAAENFNSKELAGGMYCWGEFTAPTEPPKASNT